MQRFTKHNEFTQCILWCHCHLKSFWCHFYEVTAPCPLSEGPLKGFLCWYVVELFSAGGLGKALPWNLCLPFHWRHTGHYHCIWYWGFKVQPGYLSPLMDISLGQCLTSPVLSPSLELVQIRQLSEEDCMTIIMSKEEKQEFILGRSFIYTTYVQCRNPAIVLTIMIHFSLSQSSYLNS